MCGVKAECHPYPHTRVYVYVYAYVYVYVTRTHTPVPARHSFTLHCTHELHTGTSHWRFHTGTCGDARMSWRHIHIHICICIYVYTYTYAYACASCAYAYAPVAMPACRGDTARALPLLVTPIQLSQYEHLPPPLPPPPPGAVSSLREQRGPVSE